MPLNPSAENTIRLHIAMAMAAAAIPFPGVDILGVTVLQLDLVRELARIYGVSYNGSQGKALVSSLTGAILAARVGASAAKLIPVFGSIIGGATQIILSGGSTYAVGHIFAEHFQETGTFDGLDLKSAKARFKRLFEEGKKVAEKVQKTEQDPNQRRATNQATLAHLEKLRDAGELTKEQFEQAARKLRD